MQPLILTPMSDIPIIQAGDDLGMLLMNALETAQIELADGDILVLAQKIVSKAEDRFCRLDTIQPSSQALEIAAQTDKDARFIELVLRESNEVLRTRPGTIIVEHKQGFVCANAGIDHSNVLSDDGTGHEWYLLLPEDSDRSAETIRQAISRLSGKTIGVLIIDSHGRAWRLGTVGVCIGLAGMPGLVDLRGTRDLFGYQLRVTMVAAADELAAAASLVMGQTVERIPAVHVRGFPYPLRNGSQKELQRPKEMDLFR